jgi:hypothetical protein
VAQDAINDARSICLREYGTSPDVSIYGDPSFAFAYVPSHLHHMVFELVGGGGRLLRRGVCFALGCCWVGLLGRFEAERA